VGVLAAPKDDKEWLCAAWALAWALTEQYGARERIQHLFFRPPRAAKEGRVALPAAVELNIPGNLGLLAMKTASYLNAVKYHFILEAGGDGMAPEWAGEHQIESTFSGTAAFFDDVVDAQLPMTRGVKWEAPAQTAVADGIDSTMDEGERAKAVRERSPRPRKDDLGWLCACNVHAAPCASHRDHELEDRRSELLSRDEEGPRSERLQGLAARSLLKPVLPRLK